jgi:hypothetical protein
MSANTAEEQFLIPEIPSRNSSWSLKSQEQFVMVEITLLYSS